MTDRAIKPRTDGYILIRYQNKTFEERIWFHEFVNYSLESFGVVFTTERRRRVIPWGTIRELEEHFNTDQYNKLLTEWAELDHPNHTELTPDPDCCMCLETAMHHITWGRFQ